MSETFTMYMTCFSGEACLNRNNIQKVSKAFLLKDNKKVHDKVQILEKALQNTPQFIKRLKQRQVPTLS